MLQTVTKNRDEAREQLPRALEIQKKKLLIALNERPDGTKETFSQEDENLVERVSRNLLLGFLPRPSLPWNDNFASLIIDKTLNEHSAFQLDTYLSGAKLMTNVFSSKHCMNFSNEMVYVFLHAREFNNPSKPIFQNIDVPTATSQVNKTCNESTYQPPSQRQSRFSLVERSKRLIKQLHEVYDETMYKDLNLLLTSFALIIVRRAVIKRICQCSTYYLVIEAYLNTNDEKTKKNLRDTCIKYMEWYDMQLPYLFHKVLDLYAIEAGVLWDLLSSIPSTSQQISLSLINFATEYYSYYDVTGMNPLQNRWFPYCRCLNSNIHCNLSNKNSTNICLILKYLVEMKNRGEGLTDKKIPLKDVEWARKRATELFNKINK